MHLEKMIEVKTFITPQGYDDEIRVNGFSKEDNLQTTYIKVLKKLNRAFLRESEIQEIKTIMSYHKENEITNRSSR